MITRRALRAIERLSLLDMNQVLPLTIRAMSYSGRLMGKPVIEFPDAVLLVINHLRSVIPGVEIGSRVPESRDGSFPAFIRVRRIGGFRRTLVTDRPRIDVGCWADSEGAAWDLMARARAYALSMGGAFGGTTVYKVTEVSGPQWVPDAVSGQPKYAFAFECSVRGTELD